MLKDISLSGSEPTLTARTWTTCTGVEGNTVMVNGQVNPRLNIKPGQVQRWRIVNACTARFFRLSLSSHHVPGWDRRRPPGQAVPGDRTPRLSGERVDILVKADKSSASYKFLSLPYSRMGMMSSCSKSRC